MQSSPTSWRTHNLDISVYYVVMANVMPVAYLHIKQKQSIHTQLESCLCPLDGYKSNIHFPFSSSLVSTNSWGKCVTLYLLDVRLFHQLVTSFACLTLGAWQVVYSGFIRALRLKNSCLDQGLMRAVRHHHAVNHYYIRKTKTVS